ncbi:MAG TPA: two-component regulator propeller domain-containing protein [Chthoniobacteraceae bacterium]|nr:two-component regulator propeller domain-containing protein [Chthoniobacteraceae bacterium]
MKRRNPSWQRASVFVYFTTFCALASAQLQQLQPGQQPAPKLAPAFGWDMAKQGGFVTSVAVDAQNNVWAGTEGNGLWRYDPGKKEWTQFTSKDGLGDDTIYALVVDKLGRVWAGHLNHGVSVWNGKAWKNYGVLDGPLGARVFAMATCPKDGDVWIATDCGVARYSIDGDDWDYFTTASGLPSNQIQSVAFDSDGNIYLGTQCDGVAMADRRQKYAKWSVARGENELPEGVMGRGLTSSMVNGIVSLMPPKNPQFQSWPEMLYVATPNGLSVSGDRGDHFLFIRGADWEDNEKGRMNPPAAPNQQQPGGAVLVQRRLGMGFMGGFGGGREIQLAQAIVSRAAQMNARPQEDWVSVVRGDNETGALWVGYRTKGLEKREFYSQVTHYDTGGADMNVRAIWTGPKTPVLVAVYDEKNGGLKIPADIDASLTPGDAADQAPPLPSPAKPPTADDIAPLVKRLGVYQNELKPGEAAFLGDDWDTGGDWVNHYGTSYAMLYMNEGPRVTPYEVEPGFNSTAEIGPHFKNPADQTTTYQSQSVGTNPATQQVVYNPFYHSANRSTDNRRVLYGPTLGRRSEGEVNDRSFDKDNYPLTWEGPGLWVTVEVPKGVFKLSLYFQNFDGQEGPDNKLRDYDIEILHPEESREATAKGAPLARARAVDFEGGVYKRFVVAGPAKYVVYIQRNRSYVTKLLGLFVDPAAGPAGGAKPLPGFDIVKYVAPPTAESGADPALAAAKQLWDAVSNTEDKSGAVTLRQQLRVWAYRAAAAAKAPAPLLAGWRWQMGYWLPEDRDAFDQATAQAFKAYSEKAKGDSHEEKK